MQKMLHGWVPGSRLFVELTCWIHGVLFVAVAACRCGSTEAVAVAGLSPVGQTGEVRPEKSVSWVKATLGLDFGRWVELDPLRTCLESSSQGQLKR